MVCWWMGIVWFVALLFSCVDMCRWLGGGPSKLGVSRQPQLTMLPDAHCMLLGIAVHVWVVRQLCCWLWQCSILTQLDDLDFADDLAIMSYWLLQQSVNARQDNIPGSDFSTGRVENQQKEKKDPRSLILLVKGQSCSRRGIWGGRIVQISE